LKKIFRGRLAARRLGEEEKVLRMLVAGGSLSKGIGKKAIDLYDAFASCRIRRRT
jgi:hypothetical protein